MTPAEMVKVGGHWYERQPAALGTLCGCGDHAYLVYAERPFRYMGGLYPTCHRCHDALLTLLVMSQ